MLVVTDLAPYEAHLFGDAVRQFLGEAAVGVEWHEVGRDDFSDVGGLLATVEQFHPDLVVAYRHLHSSAWKWPHSLGSQLDVLTQVTTTPVLVVPRPEKEGRWSGHERGLQCVMAMTDHLVGDHRLVNSAVWAATAAKRLVLAHVEDGAAFERYLDIIGKIDSIDTEAARHAIAERLLREPHDWVLSCRRTLAESRPDLELAEVVTMGRRLAEVERLIEEHDVDLVVLNTKDEDQLAMHGLAYPLAVELRQMPLLLL